LTIQDLDPSLIAGAIAAQDQMMTYPVFRLWEADGVTADIIITTEGLITTLEYKYRPKGKSALREIFNRTKRFAFCPL
jgi:hypothetical protein